MGRDVANSRLIAALTGYMFGTNVLDKDGISAMAVIGECAAVLEARGMTLTQQLHAIYDK